MTKMLSLDTSTVCTGWAYWENGDLMEHGVIDLSDQKPGEERLDQMCHSLIRLLNDKDPQIVVIEMTVVPNNAGTQRILSEIVGLVRGWCISHKDVEFVRLRPTEWRCLVKGEDNPPRSKKDGLKDWDVQKARVLFGFDPIDDNEADGVLIGEAYKRIFLIEESYSLSLGT